MSAAVPAATSAITSPVAGLRVSNLPPSAGSTHLLLISSLVCLMAGDFFGVGAVAVVMDPSPVGGA